MAVCLFALLAFFGRVRVICAALLLFVFLAHHLLRVVNLPKHERRGSGQEGEAGKEKQERRKERGKERRKERGKERRKERRQKRK